MYSKSAPRRSVNSSHAAAITSGDWKRSIIVSASVLAATIIPFVPMSVPPAATACQLCAEVPGTQVAVDSPAVGTTQLMSPTSVEPPPTPSTPNSTISPSEPSGRDGPPSNVAWIWRAKARSASVYSTPPTLRRFASITCPRATLGTRSYNP